jgi:hypothetical protein
MHGQTGNFWANLTPFSLKPGHQFWWYWCIGPTNPLALNTFIERPAIQARLLYWLTALHAVNVVFIIRSSLRSTAQPL